MKLIRQRIASTMRILKTGSLFWDCYAHCYDGLLKAIPYRRLLGRAVASVPAGARALLDAGCGTGNLLQAVQRQHPALTLYGLDFSEAMLRRARSKTAE